MYNVSTRGNRGRAPGRNARERRFGSDTLPDWDPTQAVGFNGNTWLYNAGLVAADSGVFSFAMDVFWGGRIINPTSPTLWVVGPDTQYTPYCELYATVPESIVMYSSDAADTNRVYWDPTDAPYPAIGQWCTLVGTVKADLPVGEKIIKLYANRVDITPPLDDMDASYLLSFSGVPFAIPDTFTNFNGSMAMARFMPEISLLTGSDIAAATLDLFCDADLNPINPGVATNALGTPAVLLYGDKDNFWRNRGNGGAFSVVNGPLTDVVRP